MSRELRVPRAQVPDGAAVRLGGAPGGVCLVRIGDDFYAIGDTCSHAEVSLSEGEVDRGGRSVECWKHGSSFSLIDGEPESLPATKSVPVYKVRVDGDDVVVSTDG